MSSGTVRCWHLQFVPCPGNEIFTFCKRDVFDVVTGNSSDHDRTRFRLLAVGYSWSILRFEVLVGSSSRLLAILDRDLCDDLTDANIPKRSDRRFLCGVLAEGTAPISQSDEDRTSQPFP